LKAYGKFTFNDSDIGVRLLNIRNKVLELIQENGINEIVFEDIQLQTNVTNNV
jgi:Holliday junction resolvasome RuvABC endonuclease subunit